MDKEKVIKDLEECLSASCRGFRPRKICPYNDDEWNIMRDVLTLLKEQEAEIRQLRLAMLKERETEHQQLMLALDIAKETGKLIKSSGGQFADMPTMQSAT